MNKLKSEVEVVLGDVKFVLRPTFEALVAIESNTGKSILRLIQEMSVADGKLVDLFHVLKEGSKAAGKELDDNVIKELILKNGIPAVQAQLVTFFENALHGATTEEPSENEDDKKK